MASTSFDAASLLIPSTPANPVEVVRLVTGRQQDEAEGRPYVGTSLLAQPVVQAVDEHSI